MSSRHRANRKVLRLSVGQRRFFQKRLAFLVDDGVIGAACDTSGDADSVFHTKLALLDDTALMGLNTAVRTGENTGVAADTFILIEQDNAVFPGQSAGDAALGADRVVTVAAGNGKADPVFLFDPDTGVNPNVFERFDHIGFSGVGKSAVVLT